MHISDYFVNANTFKSLNLQKITVPQHHWRNIKLKDSKYYLVIYSNLKYCVLSAHLYLVEVFNFRQFESLYSFIVFKSSHGDGFCGCVFGGKWTFDDMSSVYPCSDIFSVIMFPMAHLKLKILNQQSCLVARRNQQGFSLSTFNLC